MIVKYWTGFSKRKNSTKTPSTGTDAAVVLKDDTSILKPSIDSATIPANANYFYISDFGRYYYVSNVTKVGNGRNLFELEADPMSTYKSGIGATSAMIEYAGDSSDVTITDPRNKPTALVDDTYGALPFSTNVLSNSGCYILGVLSDSSNGEGGVISYYAMTKAGLQLFTAELYDQTFINSIINQFTAAQDSLISCIWIPVSLSSVVGTSATSIKIGHETLPTCKGKKITDRTLSMTTGSVSLSFPSGAGAGGSMVYIDKAPYSSGEIFLPFVGAVPLDCDLAAFTKTLEIKANIDILTGDIVYRLLYGGAWASTYNGNLATKMPVTGASYDGIGVATGALAALGGVAAAVSALWTGGSSAAVAGAMATAGGGAISAAKSLELHTMINGNASSAIGAQLGVDPWYAIYTYVPSTGKTLSDLLSPQTAHGMPYFKVDTISNHSGYVQCFDASVDITGTPQEKDAVNGYVNSGFYYE